MTRFLAVAAILPACSCITIRLAGGSSEQTVYQLDCPAPEHAPALDWAIRVRDFSCSSEYDRTGMVLVDSSGIVTRASTHRWASSPSVALSDLITRDLLSEGSYLVVLRRSVMAGDGAILEGSVREFGARQSGDSWHAVIDTDLILFDAGTGEVLAQRRIELEIPMRANGFDELSRSMSELATAWSAEARAFIRESLEARTS